MTNTIVAENSGKSGKDPNCRSGPGGTTMSGDYDLLGTGDSANCTFVSQANDLVGTTASSIDTKNSGCQLNTRAVA